MGRKIYTVKDLPQAINGVIKLDDGDEIFGGEINMRKDITVTVYEGEEGYNFNMPEKATEFIAFWQSKLALVPAEFIDSAIIEFEAERYYDSTSLAVVVSYTRPENDEEAAVRVWEEEANKARAKERKTMKYNELKTELGL
jgi:hypothetical protein